MNLFSKLPNELQEYILGFATTLQNLRDLKLVCKRFKLLVERIFDPNCLGGRSVFWNLCHRNTLETKRLFRDERIISQASKYYYFAQACCYGDTDLFYRLLENPRIDPMANENLALRWLCYGGSLTRIRILLGDSRMKLDPDTIVDLMKSVSMGGKSQILSFFLETYPITFEQNMTLLEYYPKGGECLFVLISHKYLCRFSLQDRRTVYEKAFVLACSGGYIDCVKRVLADYVGVMEANYAFQSACENNHIEIMKLLLQSSMVRISLRGISIDKLADQEVIKLLFESPNVNMLAMDLEQLVVRVDDL